MKGHEEFKPNGHKVYKWSNGNKMIEGTWKDGFKHGEFTYYNQDGSINQIINYNMGLIVGEAHRYLNNKKVMTYKYDSNTLLSSKEYYNTTLIGEYSYSDALVFPDPDAPTPPPVGTLYHAYDGKHPGEIFKGTLWTYVENSFEVDANGNKRPVDVWLREASGGKGPYVYNGAFTEYRTTDGSKLRAGFYVRVIIPDQPSISLLQGDEYLYRENGSTMYHGKWNKGIKIDKVEFSDNKDRIWKSINLNSDSSYKDGIYNIWDIGLNGYLSYIFDPKSQVASLKLLK